MLELSGFRKLIKDFGKPMTLHSVVGATYDPSTSSNSGGTPVDHDFNGYMAKTDQSVNQPTNVEISVRTCYALGESFVEEPEVGNTISGSDDLTKIVSIYKVYDEDTPVLYIMGVNS